ncbi:hypothetical protein [Streptomyces sp. NPDC059816]|uniref:hypothetical protein n=1 Tax=Streptomyces sp. NPDC059816 TaxID=3346960 RepID=UPI00365B1EC2
MTRPAEPAPARVLLGALEDRQWDPVTHPHPADWYSTGLAVTLTRADGTLAGVRLDRFTPGRAPVLEQALRQRHIEVQVGVTEPYVRGPRLTLTCPRAMTRLADLVWSEMPEPHQVAGELRAALISVGRRRPPVLAPVRPRVRGNQVEIGSLTVPQAIALQRALGGPSFQYSDWRRLDALRRLVQGRVRPVMPGVTVTAAPGCARHACPDEIRIGPAPLGHIRALTGRLTTAATRGKRRGGTR